MSLYFIDYENVNESGLEGIDRLSPEDLVVIFYSDGIKSVPMGRTVELVRSRAEVSFIRIEKTGKNYLDFQLATYMGYLIGCGKGKSTVIVSKDTGFDSVVNFWKGRGIAAVRRPSIAASKESVETKETAAELPAEPIEGSEAETAPQPEKAKAPSLPEAYRKKVRAAVKADRLSPGTYSAIYKELLESASKTALNNALVRQLGNPKGGIVYNHIKDIYEELQAAKQA